MAVRLIAILLGVGAAISIAVITYGAIAWSQESYAVPSRGSADEFAGDRQLSWSPDGASIAFISDRDGNEEIYVRDLDTGRDTRVTNNEDPDTRPTWSPDGSSVAFLSSRFLGPDIHVTDADGTEQTRLTTNRAIDGGISWSPDGSKLAFQSNLDGDYDIYVIDADGGGLTRLTDNDWSDISPAWSPDGSRIAFASNRPLTVFGGSFPRTTHDIHVMNADGSDPVNLTQNPEVNFVTQPQWSPDSRFLAFDGRPLAPLGEQFTFLKFPNEIHVSPSGGIDAGAVPITDNKTADPDLHMNPVWSPGGDRIAYVSRQTGTYRILFKSLSTEGRGGD